MKNINWLFRYFILLIHSLLHLNNIKGLIRDVTITFFILKHLFSSSLLLRPFPFSPMHLFKEPLWKCFLFFSKRLNVQIDNGQTVYDNKSLTYNLCNKESRKPNHSLSSGCPEQSGLHQWLPMCLFFAPVSNPGPTRESHICSPNHHIRCLTFS